MIYDDIQLYGGFPNGGGDGTFAARDWETYPTILNGDIAQDDPNDDGNFIAETWDVISGINAYHVLWLDGATNEPIGTTTVIDGFTVTAGYAGGSDPDDCGGGLYCDGHGGGECSPTLSHVTFSGNQADYGGGMHSNGWRGTSSPVLTNVIFSDNQAYYGGWMHNSGSRGTSNPVLTDVTFSGNQANIGGGGMQSTGYDGGISSPVLVNVILWGNWAPTGAQIYNDEATPSASYSLVEDGVDGDGIYNEGNSGVTDGGGNVSGNPKFVHPIAATAAPTTTGDYRLFGNSPAVDAGNNLSVTVVTDLDGNPRIFDGDGDGTATVDMGAYETQNPPLYLPLVMDGYITRAGVGRGDVARLRRGADVDDGRCLLLGVPERRELAP